MKRNKKNTEMTDKSLLLEARDINDTAYSRSLTARCFYHNVKNGWYKDALSDAARLNLHQTHPELYAELQTRANHQSTKS